MREYARHALPDWRSVKLLALLAVALLEASDAATGVKNLLLAGVEGMAVGAHVSEHVIVAAGAAGHEGVAARARHLNGVIIRMDTLLHGLSPMEFGGPGSPRPNGGREPEPQGLYVNPRIFSTGAMLVGLATDGETRASAGT